MYLKLINKSLPPRKYPGLEYGATPQTCERSIREMTLTKAQIVESVQNHLGFTKNRSTDLVETLLEIIKNSLENGDDVLISGFGKFCVKDKKERRGRNPANGQDLILSPRKVVTFKCSGVLRDKINNG
jgi:integration host factor subunit alpha